MAEKPEINEAAAQTMVEQSGQVSQTMQDTHPDDKDEIADAIRKGFEAYGGAMSEIAEQYQAAMKNAAELNQLVEQMRRKLNQWGSQSVEAKRGSMIRNVEQRIKDRSGEQKLSAEDNSSISGVKQIIE